MWFKKKPTTQPHPDDNKPKFCAACGSELQDANDFAYSTQSGERYTARRVVQCPNWSSTSYSSYPTHHSVFSFSRFGWISDFD